MHQCCVHVVLYILLWCFCSGIQTAFPFIFRGVFFCVTACFIRRVFLGNRSSLTKVSWTLAVVAKGLALARCAEKSFYAATKAPARAVDFFISPVWKFSRLRRIALLREWGDEKSRVNALYVSFKPKAMWLSHYFTWTRQQVHHVALSCHSETSSRFISQALCSYSCSYCHFDHCVFTFLWKEWKSH